MDVDNLGDRSEVVWPHPDAVALTDEVPVVLLESKGTLNTGNVATRRWS